MSPPKLPLWRNRAEHELVERWATMGLSRRTIELYLSAIRRVDAWCDERGYRLRTLSAHQLLEYVDELPHTWSSRRRIKSALGAYWEASGRRSTPLGAIRVPTKPRMRSRALEEHTAALLEAAARARGDHKGLAVLLGLYLGLRRAEIAALRWADFESDLAWVTIVGKGDVTARLPVHPALVSALATYRRHDSPWVFPGKAGHVVPTTVWCWVRDVATDAQLGPVPAHVLRHTCLTTANDATRDLRAVQMFARHARPDTTAGYTRVATKRVISVMLSLDYQAAAAEAS